MKNKMIKISTRVMAAVLVAASVLSTATPVYAAENTAFVEEVAVDEVETVVEEIPEYEMTVPETEGQGDVIDDEFAVVPEEVEGQGDVIDDEFAVVPEEVEGQGDVIDDEFAVVPEEVEGQGDVIDDEFAVAPEEVEGQGDVIDDEFAVAPEEVEGQGDIIDDEFAVASEECEYVTDDEFVVDESFMEVASYALGSASIDEYAVGTISDEEIKDAYEITKVDDKDKNPVTKAMETFDKMTNVFTYPQNTVCENIDKLDVLGVAEKEYAKEMTKIGFGALNGVMTTDMVPGLGAVRKGAKTIESFSKMVDSPTVEGKVINALEGVKNGLETVVSAFPGGGLVCAGVEAVGSTLKYGAIKLVSWLF